MVILIFVSISIVRLVPKALNSLANASLSIGSLLDTQKGLNTESNSSATSTSLSIRELTNQSNTGSVDYTPSNPTTSIISGNTSGVGSTDDAGVKTNTNKSTSISSSPISNSNSNRTISTTGSTIGSSDIAVEILSKGIISNGIFVPTNNFTTGDVVVIKFKVENRGQYATGRWSARIDMPSYNNVDKVRTLNNIASLPAGTAVTGEARFDNPIAGNTSASIVVDTAQTTQDTNRSNNTATVSISTTGTNTGTNYTNGTQADLQVKIISTGSINQFGQFTPNTSPRYGEKVAVQFEVSNIGGTNTPIWSWRADVSGAITNTYLSPSENALAPGSSIRLVVGFDTYANSTNIYGYNNYNYSYGYSQNISFSIVVDSNNAIYESNEYNNTATASATIGY